MMMLAIALGDDYASMHDRTSEREVFGMKDRHETRKMRGSSEDYGLQFRQPSEQQLALDLAF
jgi:hypothetical protein